jgi:tRNA A22 N-methylase
MNGAQHVRKYLLHHGFHLVYEDVFTADNRDYVLVAADGPASGVVGSDAAYRPYAGDPGWLDLALELGPTLLTQPTPSFLRYVMNWCDKWRRVLERLEDSSSESAMVKRRQVTCRLRRVESWLARQHQQAAGGPQGAHVDTGGDAQ